MVKNLLGIGDFDFIFSKKSSKAIIFLIKAFYLLIIKNFVLEKIQKTIFITKREIDVNLKLIENAEKEKSYFEDKITMKLLKLLIIV